MKKIVLALLALALAAPIAVLAQDMGDFDNQLVIIRRDCLADDFECLRLFNDCQPIRAEVTVEDNGIGLTEERVRTSVENRLRAARIYDSTSGPFLYVQVSISEGEISLFAIDFDFFKILFDPLMGRSGLANTWEIGGYDFFNEASIILLSISEFTDEFINDYLRVNEPACD